MFSNRNVRAVICWKYSNRNIPQNMRFQDQNTIEDRKFDKKSNSNLTTRIANSAIVLKYHIL